MCVCVCVCEKEVCIQRVCMWLKGHRLLYSLGAGGGGENNRPEVIVSKFSLIHIHI